MENKAAILQRQLWSRRIGDGVLRSLILLLSPLVIVTIALNLSLNPLHVLAALLHPTCILNAVLVAFVVVIVAGIFGRHATVVSKDAVYLLQPGLAIVKRMLEPSILASMLMHGFVGLALVLIWLRLVAFRVWDRYAFLVVRDEQLDHYRLNDGHMFLLLSGFLLGLVRWHRFHFRLGNIVLFPTTRCLGHLRLRANLVGIARDSLRTVCRHFKFFLLFHLLIGARGTDFIMSYFPFGNFAEPSTYSWLQLILEWSILSITTITILTLSSVTFELLLEVFRINVSRSNVFPMVESREEVSLFEALSNDSEKYLHAMALNDLVHLAAYDKERRSSVFTLSQPGGHPRRWNDVSLSCLRIMDAFIESVNKATSLMHPKKQNTSYPYQNGHIAKRRDDQNPMITSMMALIKDTKIERIIKNLIAAIRENAFFKLALDDELTNAFLHSQNAVWAIESISLLIACSMTEDRYGVVQKRAPNVVNMLLQTLQGLDRHESVLASLSNLKPDYSSSPLYWPSRRREVRNALKRALYRVCDAYGSHMGHLEVEPDLKERVLRFEHFLVA